VEPIDDRVFLEQHRAIIIRKLEEKMAELELYADTLVRKNCEIQASEDRYRGLFDHASIAIFVVERETGRVLEANSRGVSLVGLRKDELLSLPRLPFTGNPEFVEHMMEAKTYIAGECGLTTGHGSVLDVEVGVGPMTQPEDRRILLYVRDISEQKEMRERLLQGERMTLLGRLAAGIAHEIRNPLSAVTLNLQYLLQKLDGMVEVQISLRDALEGARRVEAVIENTLNLARIAPPVLGPEDLNELVQQALGFLTVSVQQNGIRLRTALAENLPRIHADARQIHQVILNIVQNAIEASPGQGEVEISTSPSPTGVALTVRDHGPGIPPDIRARLFEHMHTTKAGGTGLGLLLCKQIMERHNGGIRIDDAPGGGAVVRIDFPVQRI
jgi:PAS domain S-box-containing protein